MLNSRERRIGLVAAVVLGALALDRVLLSPLLERWTDSSADLKAVRKDLETAQQTLANDQRAAQIWSGMSGGTLMTSAPDSEGQLLNHTRTWAEASRLSLQSLKPDRSERERGFQKITVRATAVGTMQQVAQFLHQVQTANVPVRISDVQLSSRKENTDDLSVVIGLSTIYLPEDAGRVEGRR